MNNVFGLLAGVVASLLGIAARELFNWYRARQKLQAAIEVQFQEALASDSLNVLGNYLDNAVGQFSVAEYGHNQEVRRRVNMFLARVEEFVGKTDDVHPAERVGRTPVQILPAEAPQDIDLQVIEERVLGGAVWDGLALLRRVIEQRLRQLALQRGLTVHSGLVPPELSSCFAATRLVTTMPGCPCSRQLPSAIARCMGSMCQPQRL